MASKNMMAILMQMHKEEVNVLNVTKDINNCVEPFVRHYFIREVITRGDMLALMLILLVR